MDRAAKILAASCETRELRGIHLTAAPSGGDHVSTRTELSRKGGQSGISGAIVRPKIGPYGGMD